MSWSAHFYIDGAQQCGTHHGMFEASQPEPKRPSPVDLTRHGEPYGRVCSRCLKVFRAGR